MIGHAVARFFLHEDPSGLAQAATVLDEKVYLDALLVVVDGVLHTFVDYCRIAERDHLAPPWFRSVQSSDLGSDGLGLSDEDLVDEYLEVLWQSTDSSDETGGVPADYVQATQLGVRLMRLHAYSDRHGIAQLLRAHLTSELVQTLVVLYGQTMTRAADMLQIPTLEVVSDALGVAKYLNG